MQKKTSYQQTSKNKVRNDTILAAVKALTESRNDSYITPVDYVQRLINTFLKDPSDQHRFMNAASIDHSMVANWEQLHRANSSPKKAKDLKVAYLSGPEPLNDLKVFLNSGIPIENIWAFESDKKTYESAKNEALHSKYSNLKIYKTGISNFFEASPVTFDIVYLDFCSPIVGSGSSYKNLKTLIYLLKFHRLSPLGAIITNFAFPDNKQDPEGWEYRSKFTADYLYHKVFLEDTRPNMQGITDGAECKGYYLPEDKDEYDNEDENWYDEIENNLEDYYGQLITRILIDFPAVVIPYTSFYKKNISKKFINISDKNKIIFTDLLKSQTSDWLIGEFDSLRKNFDTFYRDKKFYSNFLSFFKDTTQCTAYDFCTYDFLTHDPYAFKSSLWHEGVRKMHYELSLFDQFCDVFQSANLVEMLIGQIITPYHLNVDKVKRWKYKAKSTTMFTDMVIMDQCRYIYEWFPTIGMIENEIHNKDRQLVYRFALDALAKNNLNYLPESFYGTNAIGTNEGFDAKFLSPRQKT